ncbi:GNAT family N-acetyltransferase [Aestuariibacter sp. AA17]|uniref:GNAT family N-acetyltransferase n=1 Tax=Fluctibacter corallii TaxID=2984329 RepID=A0ABT3A7D1_9ALTE|nr:GNAT family N-acetyltransferase [Aestuariibacter sp. AA17]MCV2884492.1 GNAT family N-acetyltransferase [Aestuariibacter sp. AA17]
MNNVRIRAADRQDCERVLELMKQLAEFEGYADNFAVTLEDLHHRYIEQRQFGILVGDVNGTIEGILVYFYQPFTYDLSPWMVIKELFISKASRGSGLGQALMTHARKLCKDNGGKKMKWEVLKSNHMAKAFYQKQGAELHDDWQTMSISNV